MSIELPTAARRADLKEAHAEVLKEMEAAAQPGSSKPRLVVVSKYQPSSDILALFSDSGVRHFGENYPQELLEKSKELPLDIQWHFIGALQSNKAKLLAGIPNLFAIETLSTIKAADLLEKALAATTPSRSSPLNVFIQVNTSGEDSKSGLDPLTPSSPSSESDVVKLAIHVLSSCPSLRLKGLMTIGSFTASTSDEPNPDFASLAQTRKLLLEALADVPAVQDVLAPIATEGLELSCGMSHDFVQAIQQGSTNVRVGSRIFGARPTKKETR